MRFRTVLLAAILTASSAGAQERGLRVYGRVLDGTGAFIAHANVFLLETLDGELSDSAGWFEFRSAQSGQLTLVVLRNRFREYRSTVVLPLSDSLVIRLVDAPIVLEPIRVQAGRLAAGTDPAVELTSLQIVTTPGSAADIYRALQTYPGLQLVNEGAGLFVRGGDVFETKVYLNDALVLSPYRYESPTGGFFGTFDPFLLDGIFFSTGGFGARFGDALSGIGSLETQGRPNRASVGLTASLATLSASAAAPVNAKLGLRASATRSHTDLLFRVNGTTSDYTREPQGHDLSGSAIWNYGLDSELKVFAVQQRSRLGVIVDDPTFRDAYDADERHSMAVLSWRSRVGAVRTSLSASHAVERSGQTVGAFELEKTERLRQARAQLDYQAAARLRLALGGELEHRTSKYDGRFPLSEHDGGPGAPVKSIRDTKRADRLAAFTELDWYATSRLRLTAGLRTDRSSLTRVASLDPRLAGAFRLSPGVTLIGAWGIYHQVADPFVEHQYQAGRLPPMRATHSVFGLQLGEEELQVRVEAFHKIYRDLAQENRDGEVIANGVGSSRGIDVFTRWPEWKGLSGRVSWSYLHARRTDPDTHRRVRSPYDITYVWTIVLDQRAGEHWRLSSALRSASGRPVTPIVDATFDSARSVWVPEYGEPNSERLPAFRRIDLAGSYFTALGDNRMLVIFAAVSNLLDRVNVFDYTWSSDYSERRSVRSQFKRSVYFGATLNL